MEIKIKIASLLALVGAFIALIALFMPWMTFKGPGGSFGATGWDLITDSAGAAATTFALIALVLAIIVLLLAIISILNVKIADKKTIGILMCVLGLVIVIMTYLAVWDQEMALENLGYTSVTLSYGAGMFISMIGGVLVMVAGILDATGIIKEE